MEHTEHVQNKRLEISVSNTATSRSLAGMTDHTAWVPRIFVSWDTWDYPGMSLVKVPEYLYLGILGIIQEYS